MSEEVQLSNGTRVRIGERVFVNVNPERDLHGPSVVRAANGDLLVCHQDSNAHRGGEGFVNQWRSSDGGFTWDDEGQEVLDRVTTGYQVTPAEAQKFGAFLLTFFVGLTRG